MTAEGELYRTRMDNYMIQENCLMFTQMKAKKVIEKFGGRAVAALFK